MTIRTYRDTDVEAVAALFTAAVHEVAASHYTAAQRAAWAPQPPDLAHWRRRMAGLNTLLFDTGAGLAGMIGYEDDGHIDLLFTAPGQTRSGVASRLYARVESILAQAGVTELYTEASLLARPFFERQGFVVTEAQQIPRGDQVLRRFAMRKALA